MYRIPILLVAALFVVVGCGRSETGSANANQATPSMEQRGAPADEEPEDVTDVPIDENVWRNVMTTPPEGWHTLGQAVRGEVLKRVGDVPDTFRYVSSMASKRAPGATASDERWTEWNRQSSAAVLFFVSSEQRPPVDVLDEFDGSVFRSDGERHQHEQMAWAKSEGGNKLMIALNNQHGLYIVLAVLAAEGTADDDERVIRDWAVNIEAQ
jgi:hypothetical protein